MANLFGFIGLALFAPAFVFIIFSAAACQLMPNSRFSVFLDRRHDQPMETALYVMMGGLLLIHLAAAIN